MGIISVTVITLATGAAYAAWNNARSQKPVRVRADNKGRRRR